MKLYFKSQKYINYSKRRARKSLKRRLIHKRRILHIRRSFYKKNLKEVSLLKDFIQYKQHVLAPDNLSLIDNPEEVILFFKKIHEILNNNQRVYVILKKVKNIDYGAITVLLSEMYMFKLKKIQFQGDFPSDQNAKKLIIESGFFDYIGRTDVRQNAEYLAGNDNQIITHAHKNVEPVLSLPIMKESSITIWGEKRIDSGLHSVLMELMQNTNNHASSGMIGEKHWWLSVNHDKKNKKVSFVFVDHGVGIFRSLNGKSPDSKWYGWFEKAKSSLGVETNEECLKQLLLGNLHRTVTQKSYRGKGLPNIKRMLDLNRISNLHVISNNVYSNVDKNEYKLLNKEFDGTFFYWELCENNINSPWTIQI